MLEQFAQNYPLGNGLITRRAGLFLMRKGHVAWREPRAEEDHRMEDHGESRQGQEPGFPSRCSREQAQVYLRTLLQLGPLA